MTKTWLFQKYDYIGVTDGVCGNRPIIIGTEIEPKQVVDMTVEEALEKLDLSMEQIEECYWFLCE